MTRAFDVGTRVDGLFRCARFFLVLVVLPGLITGCVSSLNWEARGSDVDVVHDLAYGSDARQQMDAYRPHDAPASGPQATSSKDLPVVVFLYGGSWQTGSKGDYAFVASALARHGYLTFVPDYRIYPQVRYPDFVEDAAHAVAYARAHAAEYGGDPKHLVLVGHSAGAYLAAMLALDPRWLKAVGMEPSTDLTAVVGLAGPYDFLPLQDDTLKIIFTTPSGLADTQPITHVSGKGPPMLILAGRNDKLVDPGNTERLAASIRTHGGRVDEIMYERSGHREIIGAFAPSLRFLSSSFADTTHYIDSELAR
jgi:acetyl esterase/lipase